MQFILALAIGVVAGSGLWLLMRPRTFQVICGLCLMAYAVNMFIFGVGRPEIGSPPVMPKGGFVDASAYADPVLALRG